PARRRAAAPRVAAAAPRPLVDPAGAAADVEQPRASDAPPERQLEPREPLSLVRHVVEAHRDQLAPRRDPERAAVVAAVVRLETCPHTGRLRALLSVAAGHTTPSPPHAR